MQLEPVFADQPQTTQATTGVVHIDEQAQRLAGIRTIRVEKGSSTRTVHAIGRVTPEDTRVYRINAGVDGFVRETYNDSVGTVVAKQQKLATYYAPEFLAAASGFLAANERVPGSVTNEGARSIQNYTDRLRNLGMSDLQIRHMAETKKLPESIDILAPVAGVILARNITSGQHFEHNMEFYRIADLSRVWVLAELYQEDASLLRPGASAQVSLRGEGRRFSARVADSLPESEAGGGTSKVRLEVENAHFALRPDMVVDVQLKVPLAYGITVPLDALVETGNGSRVYVLQANGAFEPREVQTGWRNSDRVEILRGIRPGEQVVTEAAFLVDSESRLRAPRQ
jgi:multidrug efflux pump subunit AcrA (membrane-fusion protein)